MAKVLFDVALTNDGEIGLFARGDVTPEMGKVALEKIWKLLGDDTIKLYGTTAVEKHVDNQRLQAVHDLTHEHNHNHNQAK